MKLWILRPVVGNDLWVPWYDKAFGFIVRAKNEKEARALAQAEAGDEAWDNQFRSGIPAWTDPKNSTCEPLSARGEAGIVMQDFAAA